MHIQTTFSYCSSESSNLTNFAQNFIVSAQSRLHPDAEDVSILERVSLLVSLVRKHHHLVYVGHKVEGQGRNG